MRILGIDPGKATGYAVWDSERQKFDDMWIENHSPRKCIQELQHVHDFGFDVLVVESFIPRWGQKFDLDGVYLIGAIQALYDPVMVSPSAHKALVKDSILNPLMKAGGYKIGAGHSRDAGRLCLYFDAVRNKNLKTLELISAS